MQIFIDRLTGALRKGVTNSQPINQINFQRGVDAPVELIFVADNVQAALATGSLISLVAKPKGKFDGDALVAHSDFALVGTGDTSRYVGNPPTNTAAINAALHIDSDVDNDLVYIDLIAQVRWQDGPSGPVAKSEVFNLRISNDVARGSEGTPSELPDPSAWMPAPLILTAAPTGANDATAIGQGAADTSTDPVTWYKAKTAGVGTTTWQEEGGGDGSGGMPLPLILDHVPGTTVTITGITISGVSAGEIVLSQVADSNGHPAYATAGYELRWSSGNSITVYHLFAGSEQVMYDNSFSATVEGATDWRVTGFGDGEPVVIMGADIATAIGQEAIDTSTNPPTKYWAKTAGVGTTTWQAEGGGLVQAISSSNYYALSPEEQNNGTIYYLFDA